MAKDKDVQAEPAGSAFPGRAWERVESAEAVPPESALPDDVAGAATVATVVDTAETHEPRNLLVMGLYDIVIRIGWIFKTESVIMPAFLDQVAGAGWLRGVLPVVNRFGQSLPPAFYAPRLRHMPLKKFSLSVWTLAMGIVFLSLAGMWWHFGASKPSWMAGMFLLLYAAFSSAHGINQLSYGTVQGKLISIRSRGRLMSWILPIGATLAVVCAWWLMGRWLREQGGFVWIFGFTGVCFVIGSALALALREPRDAMAAGGKVVERGWTSALAVFRHDANFRRFALVAMLSSTTVILFPHYQALGRQQLGLDRENLMIWVVVQNLAVAVFGFIIGRIVHGYGERLALRITILGTALAPLTAVFVAYLDPALGKEWFWIVFIPIGMTPISQKTMLGYTLEVSAMADHPRYLSALSLCQAAPFVISPAVGWLVDLIGFEPVMVCGAVLLLFAGAMTWRIDEPRHGIGV